MDTKSFLDALANLNSMWSIAGFAIAALLAILHELLASPAAARRRGTKPPAFLAANLIWPLVIVLCVLAGMPILAHTYLESKRIQLSSVYRIRVTVLDPQGHPSSGAMLRTTASNETSVTEQGGGLVAIPSATLPADRKITIYADLDSAFQHGRADLQLGDDVNPSVTITLAGSRDATVTGLVEDANGRAVQGATVQVVGGESGTTAWDGGFVLKTNAAVGQTVRLHAQKDGYQPVEQDHPAGREPVTIVLAREGVTRQPR